MTRLARRRSGGPRLALFAALTAALVLLFPAVTLATGGRIAPADPVFLDYIRSVRAGTAGPANGYVPSPLSGAAVPRASFAPLMARYPSRFVPGDVADAPASAAASTSGTLDLRVLGKLPAVRDQGRYGTCWAFAAMASLESGLLPDQAWDFSENNLAHRAGFALGFGGGGNSSMATAYLVRWAGPVNEADDPYAPYASSPDPSPTSATVRKHVHEVLELPSRTSATDNANLKWAVSTYGAVEVSMFWSNTAYRRDTAAYYYSGASANHAVACVGWDDSFPASRFVTPPPGNGAFLVRNSWGTGFGDRGYFWVSYHDTAFAGESTVFAGAETAAGGDRIYQHDPLGWIASYRPAGASDPTTAWFASVFTPAEAAALTAAGFYTTAPNAACEVRVAKTIAGIRDATASARGVIAVSGYHTMELGTPVALAAGEQVVIAVRVTVPGYTYPVPIERPYAGYAQTTAVPGQSYVSGDGLAWKDMTTVVADTDVCLKGYATTAGSAPEPAPSATPGAPSLRLSGATSRPGGAVRIAYRVTQSGATSGTATVTFRVRDRRGSVVRSKTVRGVSLTSPHAWRMRCPRHRGIYRIVAIAGVDTGLVSTPAAARLRVR